MIAALLPLVLVLAVASAGFSQTYTSGDWTYTLNASNEATITGYSGAGGALTIPSSLDGSSVSDIGPHAFKDRTGLTSVNIPDSVTSVGMAAFYGCTGLTSVSIGSGVTSIRSYTFAGCSGLTSVSIPGSVTSIGTGAFIGCTGLTSVSIGSGVTSISSWAFQDCTGLNSIAIPNSVTHIGDGAFSFCSSLLNVYLPPQFKDTFTSFGLSSDQVTIAISPSELNVWLSDSESAGVAKVTSNPNLYNLYTSDSIMDLRMGGAMVQKQGNNAVVTFQTQTTTDLATQPFTNNGTPITNHVPMPGNKGFLRVQAR